MKNTKAFTLVELIVVITILAILGTIAFISLQGYSAEARDSKRISDVSNIAKKVSLMVAGREARTVDDFHSTAGTNFAGLVASGTVRANNEASTGTVLSSAADGNYGVGSPDFAALQQSGEDFKDPSSKDDYVYAYETVGDTFQVAASLEVTAEARVVGNYVQFDSGDVASLIFSGSAITDGGSVLPY